MPAKTKKAKQKTGKAKSAPQSVRVRMYRGGLGDCFLLTFPGENGSFHLLVDCGVFFQTPNEQQRMRDIATHIKATTGGTIDVLVGTHEHYDHLIGFKHAKDVFAGMTIKEVWLSWIEKPGDPRAAWLRALENKLKLGLQLALKQAMASPSLAPDAPGLQNLLQFGGNPLAADYSEALGEVKRWLRDELTSNVQYLEPHAEARELVPGVRVYPLGPPIKESFFRKMNDSKQDPETYGSGFAMSAVPAFMSVGAAVHWNQPVDPQAATALAMPFDARWQISADKAAAWRTPVLPELAPPAGALGEEYFSERYGFVSGDAAEWRRIDNNWLAEARAAARLPDQQLEPRAGHRGGELAASDPAGGGRAGWELAVVARRHVDGQGERRYSAEGDSGRPARPDRPI